MNATLTQIARQIHLPSWATVAHTSRLAARRAGMGWWWISGNGTACGMSSTERGASRAAARSANADARRSGGPAPWTAVGAFPAAE